MRPISPITLLACFVALTACAQASGVDAARTSDASVPQTPLSPTAAAWFSDVRAIADADTGDGRRLAIQRRLDELGIQWRAHPFEADAFGGTNLVADVAGDADDPLLLLGAHWDQVSKGEGATDNASGSATVLALAQRLKERPLKNHRLAVAFWDLEEKGLLGAKAFVSDGAIRPKLYVNFDVFAWGDTVWMMTPDSGGTLAASSAKTTASQGLKLSAGERYPPTDHLPFLKAGWPAVSYSLVGQDEITLILDAYDGRKPKATPKVMHVIHTDRDTMANIDAAAAARGLDAVEQALRHWDELAIADAAMSQ